MQVHSAILKYLEKGLIKTACLKDKSFFEYSIPILGANLNKELFQGYALNPKASRHVERSLLSGSKNAYRRKEVPLVFINNMDMFSFREVECGSILKE